MTMPFLLLSLEASWFIVLLVIFPRARKACYVRTLSWCALCGRTGLGFEPTQVMARAPRSAELDVMTKALVDDRSARARSETMPEMLQRVRHDIGRWPETACGQTEGETPECI
jgi:hypothetical protein